MSKVRITGSKYDAQIEVDGQKVRDCIAYRLRQYVNEAPRLTLQIYATELEVEVEASPTIVPKVIGRMAPLSAVLERVARRLEVLPSGLTHDESVVAVQKAAAIVRVYEASGVRTYGIASADATTHDNVTS